VGAVAMYDFLVDYAARGEIAYAEWAAATKKHPLGGFGLFDLTGFPKVMEMEQKYLSPEALKRYEQSIGVYDPRTGQSKLAAQAK
jgi:hypothetical protein